MDLRHVEKVNYLSQVLNKADVLSPKTCVASEVIDENHEPLEKVRVHQLAFMLWCHVNGWEFGRIVFKIVSKSYAKSSILLC